jgi:RNA polymerase sigma-70 factor (ECF subfamily)
MPEVPSDAGRAAENRQFATTQWSIVLAAGDAGRDDARDALTQLCESYWYPLYAYVRRRGYSANDAQDLTQAFFAQLLEKQTIKAADPQRGKFRSFLLASMDHFLANERERAKAKKRGGDRVQLSLDFAFGESRVNLEPTHDVTPERLFVRHWALTLLDVVVRRLEEEFQAAGKAKQFELLRDALSGGRQRLPYAKLAVELAMTPEAVRQAAHRMRRRYRALLREEVARTVSQPGDVDEEIRSLFESLGN